MSDEILTMGVDVQRDGLVVCVYQGPRMVFCAKTKRIDDLERVLADISVKAPHK